MAFFMNKFSLVDASGEFQMVRSGRQNYSFHLLSPAVLFRSTLRTQGLMMWNVQGPVHFKTIVMDRIQKQLWLPFLIAGSWMCDGYSLRIVGHSLGSAIAALLGMREAIRWIIVIPLE